MKIEKIIEMIRDEDVQEGDKFRVKSKNYGDIDIMYRNDVLEEDGTDIFELYEFRDIISFDFEEVKTILLDNLELVGTNLNRDIILGIKDGNTLEIIKWDYNFDSYIVVGYWEKDEMGYNFKFIGNRFEEVDDYDLLELITNGQKILNEKYKNNLENNVNYSIKGNYYKG